MIPNSEKSAIRIYTNNFIAYSIFKSLKIFENKNSKEYSNNILFINTGQIGDLMVSSLLMENEDKLPQEYNYNFVFKDNFEKLFSDYKGKFNLIPYNYFQYKYNPFYKISFLNRLKNLKSLRCYNLTAARGILVDEMALLSGSKEIFCTDNSWKYLKKLFGKRMDAFYSKVLFKNTSNEYEKHLKLLNKNFDVFKADLRIENKFTFIKNPGLTSKLPTSYLTFAPFSSIVEKSWPLKKFRELAEKLSEHDLILLGSKSQFRLCEREMSGLSNVENCCGKYKLNEVASIIYDSKFHIGNDSGLTHVALKLGVPFASIIGGYNFNKFFPFEYDGMNGKYFFVQLDCFGCEWNCIYNRAKCLTDVEVDEVYEYVSGKLNFIN